MSLFQVVDAGSVTGPRESESNTVIKCYIKLQPPQPYIMSAYGPRSGGVITNSRSRMIIPDSRFNSLSRALKFKVLET